MTVAVWPSALPRPNNAGFEYKIGESRLRAPQGAGPSRNRRRFSGRVDLVSITLTLSIDQSALFQNFYKYDLADGSLPFIMPNYINDGWPLGTETGAFLTTETGDVLTISNQQLSRFGSGLPSTTPLGLKVVVSFEIEILP
jgi:hypothetical protein